jgi:hypothetical protein
LAIRDDSLRGNSNSKINGNNNSRSLRVDKRKVTATKEKTGSPFEDDSQTAEAG